MKNSPIRKLSESEHYAAGADNTYDNQRLFVSTDSSAPLIQRSVYTRKRFRGDILIYFIAVGIWLFGTVWMVIKLIDSFF